MFYIDAFNDPTSEHDRFGDHYIIELEGIGFTYDEKAKICYYMVPPIDDTSPMITFHEDGLLTVLTKCGAISLVDPSIDTMAELIEKLEVK